MIISARPRRGKGARGKFGRGRPGMMRCRRGRMRSARGSDDEAPPGLPTLPPTDVLGVCAKWPVPGGANARLALPADTAAAVARAFLLDALERLAAVRARRVLAHAPAEREADFHGLAAGRYSVVP